MKKLTLSLISLYHSTNFYKNRLLKRWNHAQNPHKLKEDVIIKYCNEYNYKVLVETGTYMGEMVYSMRNNFNKLYTIELSRDLFRIAKKHFGEFKNIKFLQGDSGVILGSLINEISEPAIFWLDGHYSDGITAKSSIDTPILQELRSVFSSPFPHVILIDDARCFGNHEYPDYPSIEELGSFVRNFNHKSSIKIENDIIRITPERS